MYIEYSKLTDGQKLIVRGMFHPTRLGYDGYLYEITSGGWVLSRKKRDESQDAKCCGRPLHDCDCDPKGT